VNDLWADGLVALLEEFTFLMAACVFLAEGLMVFDGLSMPRSAPSINRKAGAPFRLPEEILQTAQMQARSNWNTMLRRLES
jgi:hypothetical protein